MTTDKTLKAKTDSDLMRAIEEGFPGPRTIDKWTEVCREKICNMTIVEEGTGRDELIKSFNLTQSSINASILDLLLFEISCIYSIFVILI